jgi:hypothetical protein
LIPTPEENARDAARRADAAEADAARLRERLAELTGSDEP